MFHPLFLSLPPSLSLSTYLSIYLSVTRPHSPDFSFVLRLSTPTTRLTHPRSPPRTAPALFSSISLRPRNLNRHRVVVHRHRYRVSRTGRAICCYHQLFASLLVVGGVAAAACCEQEDTGWEERMGGRRRRGWRLYRGATGRRTQGVDGGGGVLKFSGALLPGNITRPAVSSRRFE